MSEEVTALDGIDAREGAPNAHECTYADGDITESMEESKDAPITEGASGGGAEASLDDVAATDLAILKHEFSELSNLESVAELENAARYGALRDLGLTPREAYLATAPRRIPSDNRSHLRSAVAARAGVPAAGISQAELSSAREIFAGLSDKEIRSLYKRVTQ